MRTVVKTQVKNHSCLSVVHLSAYVKVKPGRWHPLLTCCDGQVLSKLLSLLNTLSQ